tara:strand:+ start:133 stop:1611 length:1479 start_codon:yes stop_codon:yes gene_type:complete
LRGVDEVAMSGALLGNVDIAYVARGRATMSPLLEAMMRVSNWTATPARLRFHVLAGTDCMKDLARVPLHTWCERIAPSLHCDRIHVIDATKAALKQRMSSLAVRWLENPDFGGKASKYLVPKLFINELLSFSVQQVLILDTDMVLLADVCELYDGFAVSASRAEDPLLSLGYALEQQGAYRWMVNWSSPHPDALGQVDDSRGFNGGVGLQRLDRLRGGAARGSYYGVLEGLLQTPREYYGFKMEACKGNPPHSLLYCALHRPREPHAIGRRRFAAAIALGDQTVLAIAVAAQPKVMRRLIRPLPCEWNWQTCIAEYARLSDCLAVGSSLVAASSRCKLAFRDDTCQTPPKLLHFNCPNDLKRLLDTNEAGLDGPSFSQSLNELRLTKKQLTHAARAGCPDKIAEPARLALESAIGNAVGLLHAATRHKFTLRACKQVQHVFPEIKSRSCNASWLLSGALQRIGPAPAQWRAACSTPAFVDLGRQHTAGAIEV